MQQGLDLVKDALAPSVEHSRHTPNISHIHVLRYHANTRPKKKKNEVKYSRVD